LTIIAGVDVGNSTTEATLADVVGGEIRVLASGLVPTTGIKGTPQNSLGVVDVLKRTAKRAGLSLKDIKEIRLNEATPVIGDVAMETITETIITESTMIGHNPDTPGGLGLGIGKTVSITDLEKYQPEEKLVVVVPKTYSFQECAEILNRYLIRGLDLQGAIVEKDDGVLINNRLKKIIPIVDEVKMINLVPLGMDAALEVAALGESIKTLSNPYGIATVFSLTPEETKMIVPVARALIGNRSAVVIRTPLGDVNERRIPAGKIIILGQRQKEVDVQSGAEKINSSVEEVQPLLDVEGESGTNVGGMIARIKNTMGNLTNQQVKDMKIQDLLAVDTYVPVKVQGGIAGEVALENAVGLAAMVKTNKLQMDRVAKELEQELGIKVRVAGVEAEMAVLGALTTPGVDLPMAILDLGGGSTDAALRLLKAGTKSVHLAGAGEMVTMLINAELGLNDMGLAEEIKQYPLAKVESLFHIRLETGSVKFFPEPLDPRLFARVVIMKGDGNMVPISARHSMERIRSARRDAKSRVFVTNTIRALTRVAPGGNIRNIFFVVLVGGSALDFEIPEMITERLAEYGIVAGRGNIRGQEGPRNAVATGLVYSYQETKEE